MSKLKYTISETSKMLGSLSYRTLHYYEKKFNILINRDKSGNRIYTDDNIKMFEKIIELKKKGMTLDGIKLLFEDKGIIKSDEDNNIVVVDEKSLEIKDIFISKVVAAISKEFHESLKDTNNRLDQLITENVELKEQVHKLQRQSVDHYSKVDEQLTLWRESEGPKKSWLNKIFSK